MAAKDEDAREQELEFCKEVMSVLCGVKEVPDKPGVIIKDRSVHPEFSNRDIALEYMTSVVKKMQFSVPVKIDHQVWVEDDVLIYGNLVVIVEGNQEKEKAIIVGAHYDVQNNLSSCWRGRLGAYTVTQGADDNTSGTVGCLTLLRRLSTRPPKYTTVVVCFDGEEPGEYNGLAVGSEFFVKNYTKQNTGLTFMSSVIADMIGATPTNTKNGFVIATSKHIDDGKLQNEATAHVNIPTNITVLDPKSRLSCLKLSDSVNTERAGIPTVLLSYLSGFSALPDFYHTERDTMDIINWKSFQEAVDLMEYLASEPLPTRSGGDTGPTPIAKLVQQIMEMGFSKEQAEFALIQTNNDLEGAISLLF